jgi:ABC-type Fe3+-hydroxamate transport system substrate-binding protein
VVIDIVPEVERSGLDPAAAVADWSGLRELAAVRNARVHVLGRGVMEIPGPRIAEAVEAVAELLHPVAQGGRG